MKKTNTQTKTTAKTVFNKIEIVYDKLGNNKYIRTIMGDEENLTHSLNLRVVKFSGIYTMKMDFERTKRIITGGKY